MMEHSAEKDVTTRCQWGLVGLPACRAGTRGTRYWCAACAPLLDPRPNDHHPNCYQNTGVPDDLPDALCDCRVLRIIDAETDAPCAGCEHPKSRHASMGCLVEKGDSGSGSVADAVFCRCDTYVLPPEAHPWPCAAELDRRERCTCPTPPDQSAHPHE